MRHPLRLATCRQAALDFSWLLTPLPHCEQFEQWLQEAACDERGQWQRSEASLCESEKGGQWQPPECEKWEATVKPDAICYSAEI